METLGMRIRKIRTDLPGKVTQKTFGEALGVSCAVITSYELGKVTPPPATIRLICVTFGVNQEWLETGDGDPYVTDQNIALVKEVRDLLKGEPYFRVAVMASMAAMPDEWWDLWESQFKKEIEAQKKGR